MEPIKILAIVPYEGLKEIIAEIVNDMSDIVVDTYVGDLKVGAELAQQLQGSENYNAIISRAGTAELIKQIAKIPVIEIRISPYDILRAIRTAQNFNGSFAIVGFSHISECAKELCSLLQYSINIYTIHNEESLTTYCMKLKKENFSLIIGDVITTTVARQIGFNTVLVTSSRDSVRVALNQAVILAIATQKLRQSVQTYRSLLEHSESVIVSFNMTREIVYTNTDLKNVLYKNLEENLKRYLLTVKKKGEIKLIKRIGQNLWNIRGKLILTDSQKNETIVFYCSVAANIDIPENNAIKFHNFDDEASLLFETFYAKSKNLAKTIEYAKKYSKYGEPVLISGARGTGKDTIAYVLANNNPLHNAPLIIIDCYYAEDKQWKVLFHDPNSPLAFVGYTFYFKNLQCLSKQQAQNLASYLENSLTSKRNRIIFSYIPQIQTDCEFDELLSYIRNKIGALMLTLQPFNECKEDIPNLAVLYLNELNVELGKQVIGLEDSAVEELKNFNWVGNLEQFQHVMYNIVALTDKDYIDLDCVRHILKTYTTHSTDSKEGISLDGDLSDIVSRVIQSVLEEEGMNQSKAAKRLGISRSTMWRKLNE